MPALPCRSRNVAGRDVGGQPPIAAELEHASRENVLAPLVAAENAAEVWDELDLSRKRAVIKTLMRITLQSPGRGARRPFDSATVTVAWKQPDAA